MHHRRLLRAVLPALRLRHRLLRQRLRQPADRSAALRGLQRPLQLRRRHLLQRRGVLPVQLPHVLHGFLLPVRGVLLPGQRLLLEPQQRVLR